MENRTFARALSRAVTDKVKKEHPTGKLMPATVVAYEASSTFAASYAIVHLSGDPQDRTLQVPALSGDTLSPGDMVMVMFDPPEGAYIWGKVAPSAPAAAGGLTPNMIIGGAETYATGNGDYPVIADWMIQSTSVNDYLTYSNGTGHVTVVQNCTVTALLAVDWFELIGHSGSIECGIETYTAGMCSLNNGWSSDISYMSWTSAAFPYPVYTEAVCSNTWAFQGVAGADCGTIFPYLTNKLGLSTKFTWQLTLQVLEAGTLTTFGA